MKIKVLFLFLLFYCLFCNAQTFTSSNLPIVLITTDMDANSGQPSQIPDDFRVGATMKIIYHPDGSRNFLSDQNTQELLNYSGRITIETRGSTSQILEKKPYGLTTVLDDNITNNNVSILNLPTENDWILNSLAFDDSLIRDYLSYSLAREMGDYAARVNYCEVVINGDYRGIYLFSEKIKVDSKRVNIVKLTPNDTEFPDLSGGYITKCDKTTGNDPVAWSFTTNIFNDVNFIHDTPSPQTVTLQQDNYIFNQFRLLELMANEENSSIVTGYPSLIDIPTFVDFMIMNELASNVDGYQLSSYFHKDRNGKLRAGPIWDFNLAYGLDVFGDRSQPDVWQFDNGDNVGAKFWKNLFDNSVYKCYLEKRWHEVTAPNQPLNYNSITQKINQLVTVLNESSIREHQRWGTVPNIQSNCNQIKTWLQQRFVWLNQHLVASSSCTFPELPAVVISKINYNPEPSGPYNSNSLEFIELTNNSNTTINLSGFYFKELGITYIFPNNTSLSPNDNLYLASDATAFFSQYGFEPFGTFTRNLSNKSQLLSLANPFGTIVDTVEYLDNTPWPTAADGNGSYLKLIDLNLDNALASSWVASEQSLSTTNFDLQNQIMVYPNPFNSLLNINSSASKISSYELTDMLGRIIVKESNLKKNNFTINLENISSQQYVLKIINEDGQVHFRKVSKI